MAFFIPESTRAPREPVAAGMHVGRLIWLVDLGIQDGGKFGAKRQLYVKFEVPGHRVQFEGDDGQQRDFPGSVGAWFSLTMGTKEKPSNLRKLVEGWRSKTLSDAEARRFDLNSLLGKVCTLSVIHGEKADGSVYAKLNTVLPSMAKDAPVQEGASISYNTDEHDQSVFESLPTWLQDKINGRIKAPQSFARTFNKDAVAQANSVKKTAAKTTVDFDDDLDSVIPFSDASNKAAF